METISIANQKGGVGKTTTCHTLGSGLVKKGFKVLLIDTDPQMNLTYTSGFTAEDIEFDLSDVIQQKCSINQAIKHTDAGFDLICGSVQLITFDSDYTSKFGKEYMLQEAIKPIKEEYDFCIIDTSPTLALMTTNTFVASDSIIIPIGTDIYSLQGLAQLQGLIDNVRKYCNKNLKIDGLLITKYNNRTVINRSLKDELERVAERLETKLYKTTVREAIAVKEVQFLQTSLFEEYPKSNVTKDYQAFINEFIKERKNNHDQ